MTVRLLAGLLAFNGLALLLGLGLLLALGLVDRRLPSLAAAAGPALLAGVAVLGLGALFALLAGLGMDVLALSVAGLAAAAALALAGLRRSPRGPREAWRPPPAAVWGPAALVVAFVAVQAIASRDVPIAWDASHNWTLKAVALFHSAELEGQLFTDAEAFTIAHLDYPLLHPVLGALAFRFAGTADQGVLLAELWIVLGAAVLAVPWLLQAGRWTWLAYAPMLLALAAAPTAGLLRGDADVPMAGFLAAGGVALLRAGETSRLGFALLAGLWLGAAANVKNEGLAFALAVVAVAAVVAALQRRRAALAAAGTAAGLAVLLALPWQVWVARNGPFNRDVAPLSESLDPGYLADRLDQLDMGAQALLGRLADAGHYWILPALLAVTVAALVAGRARPVAGYYLGAVALCMLAVLWTYWTSQLGDVAGHIERTTIRTVTGPIFLAAAGLAHLLPRLIEAALPERPEPPRPAS